MCIRDSNYAGHFIVEAEKQGYVLPSGMKSNWIRYQNKMANKFNVYDQSYYSYYKYRDITQAYRLFTLALANSPNIGAMNRLRESSSLTLPARWRLAAAYALSGQTDIAEELINGVGTEIPKYREISYSYGSNTRDEAMILETLVLLKDPRAAGLAKRIADALSNGRYMSTQTTAYSLISIGKFLSGQKTSKTMKFSLLEDDNMVAQKNTQVPIFTHSIKENQSKSVTIKNEGDAIMYARFISERVPVMGDATDKTSHVKLDIRYLDTDKSEIDPSQLEQGTDFIAEVVVTNLGTRGYLADMTLNQLFPSGWEIHNSRMDGFNSTLYNSSFDYQDIRDDRIYTYYNLPAGKTKTYQVKLNATYLGKYYLPTVQTESMYDEEIASHRAGKWVEVVKQTGN